MQAVVPKRKIAVVWNLERFGWRAQVGEWTAALGCVGVAIVAIFRSHHPLENKLLRDISIHE